eukprot:511156-Pelagomonas_calceolata.AAC.2
MKAAVLENKCCYTDTSFAFLQSVSLIGAATSAAGHVACCAQQNKKICLVLHVPAPLPAQVQASWMVDDAEELTCSGCTGTSAPCPIYMPGKKLKSNEHCEHVQHLVSPTLSCPFHGGSTLTQTVHLPLAEASFVRPE